jgi:hypothetical protein
MKSRDLPSSLVTVYLYYIVEGRVEEEGKRGHCGNEFPYYELFSGVLAFKPS